MSKTLEERISEILLESATMNRHGMKHAVARLASLVRNGMLTDGISPQIRCHFSACRHNREGLCTAGQLVINDDGICSWAGRKA